MTELPKLCALLLLCAGCDDHKSAAQRDAGPTEPSPNASILPAPLASGIETAGAGKADDAGADAALPAEPRALREDQALSADAPREGNGLTLTARFRWLNVAAPARVPELNPDGVQRARDATGFDIVIDLAGGRMRFAFASRTFTLPAGSELHARDDLYGSTLLWPNRTSYTVLAP